MPHQAKATEGHWSHYWTTDQAAECLSYFKHETFGEFTDEHNALYSKLWNDVGPGKSLADNWGALTEAEQVELDAAYAREYND
jgi:hypothetical protein